MTIIRHKCIVRQFFKASDSGRTLWRLADVSDWSFMYEGCLESIQPFWISREPVARPWCKLAVSQTRPYCASVNSHSPVGLVSRQWDAFWLSLWTVWPSHSQWPSEQICFITTMHLSILQFSCRPFFLGGGAKHHITQGCQPPPPPLQPRFGSLRLLAFPILKSPLKGRRFVKATVTQ